MILVISIKILGMHGMKQRRRNARNGRSARNLVDAEGLDSS
jgi:hypothetical protein